MNKLEHELGELAGRAVRGQITPEQHDEEHARILNDEMLRGRGLVRQGGYWVQPNGTPIAAGVVCRCGSGTFCPAHGK